jgi:hypothetical protein
LAGLRRAAIVSPMQLKYLKRVRSRQRVWPPSWGRHGPPVTPRFCREGVLGRVYRIGSRLSVTIRFEGHDYVTLLDQWQSPPTVDAVEATLRRGLGRTIQAVGRVEMKARGRPLPVGRRPSDP